MAGWRGKEKPGKFRLVHNKRNLRASADLHTEESARTRLICEGTWLVRFIQDFDTKDYGHSILTRTVYNFKH
jgi:hypothetical protein